MFPCVEPSPPATHLTPERSRAGPATTRDASSCCNRLASGGERSKRCSPLTFIQSRYQICRPQTESPMNRRERPHKKDRPDRWNLEGGTVPSAEARFNLNLTLSLLR